MLRASAAILILLLSGCSTSRVGEFGEDLCSNQRDDDGDGRIDCKDPDCLGAEHCRVGLEMDSGATGMDAATTTTAVKDAGRKPEAGTNDAGHPIAMDAGHRTDATMPKLDAAMDDEASVATDAGPLTCMAPCAANEECVSGQCQTVAVNQGGKYTLKVTEAQAPSYDLNGCFDTDCGFSFAPLCPCGVDLFVRVFLTRNATDTRIGDTSVVVDTIDALFMEAGWPVTLAPGDVLRFEVWDDDTPDPSMQVYTCKPDLKAIPGQISCLWFSPSTRRFNRVVANLQAAP